MFSRPFSNVDHFNLDLPSTLTDFSSADQFREMVAHPLDLGFSVG